MSSTAACPRTYGPTYRRDGPAAKLPPCTITSRQRCPPPTTTARRWPGGPARPGLTSERRRVPRPGRIAAVALTSLALIGAVGATGGAASAGVIVHDATGDAAQAFRSRWPGRTSDATRHLTETERVRRIQDKEAPRYDRQMGRFERILFAGGREWACSRVQGEVL